MKINFPSNHVTNILQNLQNMSDIEKGIHHKYQIHLLNSLMLNSSASSLTRARTLHEPVRDSEILRKMAK